MRYDQEVSVDGESYMVHAFPATKALKILTRLTKLVGEPLSVFGGGIDGKAEELIPKAVRALAERLDENDVELLVKDILRSVSHGGVSVADKFETHFQLKFGHLFKLLASVLKFQYGDFFSVLAASAPQAVASKPSKSRNT